MDAFLDSELTFWWGPVSVMRSWNEERIRRRFADINTHQFKVVDDANGAIIAWAKWDPPPQMTGLREGFIVYDEVGELTSVSRGGGRSDSRNKDGEEAADGKTSVKTYALGPPQGSDTVLFHKFFDGLLSMEKKYQSREKLGEILPLSSSLSRSSCFKRNHCPLHMGKNISHRTSLFTY
jgi:hypothetical protein